MAWACYLCTRAGRESGPRLNSRSVICEDCNAMLRAQGRRWCAMGRHVTTAARCYDCQRVYQRARYRRERGIAAPPSGFVAVPALAAQMRTPRHTILGWLRRGWPVPTHRVGRHIYVAMLPEYPAPPDGRKAR